MAVDRLSPCQAARVLVARSAASPCGRSLQAPETDRAPGPANGKSPRRGGQGCRSPRSSPAPCKETSSMLAIHLIQFGEPERSLKVVDVPEPSAPGAGQALIQVEYAPLDHHDLLLARASIRSAPSCRASSATREPARSWRSDRASPASAPAIRSCFLRHLRLVRTGPGGSRETDRRGQVHQPRTSGDAHHQPHHRGPAAGVA